MSYVIPCNCNNNSCKACDGLPHDFIRPAGQSHCPTPDTFDRNTALPSDSETVKPPDSGAVQWCDSLDLRTEVLLHRTGYKSNSVAVRELSRRLVYTEAEYVETMVNLQLQLAERLGVKQHG